MAVQSVSTLNERVLQMPYDRLDEFLSIPPDDARVWRYIDFFQLVSLLGNGKLYFPRLTTLQEQDLFEGTFPLSLADELGRGILREERKQWIPTYYVSCWHVNQHESMAMWRLYANRAGGVAIQTTFGDFKRAFDRAKEAVNVGLVRYLDYETDPIGSEWSYVALPVTLKRKSFAHENELRAYFTIADEGFRVSFLDDYDRKKRLSRASSSGAPEMTTAKRLNEMPSGIAVNVDVPLLVKSIYVAPGTADWQMGVIGDVLKKYGSTETPIRSRLDDTNLY
jgi:hypothetical protein